jgi:hypothetical protein
VNASCWKQCKTARPGCTFFELSYITTRISCLRPYNTGYNLWAISTPLCWLISHSDPDVVFTMNSDFKLIVDHFQTLTLFIRNLDSAVFVDKAYRPWDVLDKKSTTHIITFHTDPQNIMFDIWDCQNLICWSQKTN